MELLDGRREALPLEEDAPLLELGELAREACLVGRGAGGVGPLLKPAALEVLVRAALGRGRDNALNRSSSQTPNDTRR